MCRDCFNETGACIQQGFALGDNITVDIEAI